MQLRLADLAISVLIVHDYLLLSQAHLELQTLQNILRFRGTPTRCRLGLQTGSLGLARNRSRDRWRNLWH